jgi:MFS superfamily sulfate permease-like transporter
MAHASSSAVSPPRGRGWTQDLLSSLVVFLVALPLCMGIARACGLPVEAGILTGIIGGIVVGSLAGCPLQVSGPAAGLILVVSEIISDDPDYGLQVLALSLVLAGVLQIIAGLLRLGQWFRAVSPAVIEGMLAGIGLTIVATQLPIMLDAGSEPSPPPAAVAAADPAPADAAGADAPANPHHEPKHKPHGSVGKLLALPSTLYHTFDPPEGEPSRMPALLLGLLTLAVILFWGRLVPKSLKVIPAAFPAVILATIVSEAFRGEAALVRTVGQLPDLLGSVRAGLTWPPLEEIWPLLGTDVLIHGVTIAFVASAETLLCAGAVDTMVPGQRTKYDKELTAQGLGNLLCGLLHALPMTGVIVRSKANIEAGAQTRLSAILHGVWLLLCLSFFSFLLARVPLTSLATILVYTGFRLMNPRVLKELLAYGWMEVVICLVTMAGVVVFGLLEGVLMGMGLAAAKLLYTFSHLSIHTEEDPANRRTVLHLEGAATFIRLPQLAAALEKIPGNTELHVEMQKLNYIDHACLELLVTWEKQHEATGGDLVIDWDSLHARFSRRPSSAPANGHAKHGAPANEPANDTAAARPS